MEAKNLTLEEIDSPESWIEYCNVFGKDGKWRYFECGHLSEGLKDLKEDLDEEYRRRDFSRPEGNYGFYTAKDIEKLRYDCRKQRESDM